LSVDITLIARSILQPSANCITELTAYTISDQDIRPTTEASRLWHD